MDQPEGASESRPTLLVIDDDRELCAMLAEYLAPEGLTALTAGTGKQGLEQLARAAVDLVVLDVMLPELSGFEVLRRIRTGSRVPVVMLPAGGEAAERAQPRHPRQQPAQKAAEAHRPGDAAERARLGLRAHPRAGACVGAAGLAPLGLAPLRSAACPPSTGGSF